MAVVQCPACSAQVPESRFCGSCGARLEAGSSATPTRAAVPGALSSSSDVAGGRFLPGAILAERYRIIGLLGKGGMGEVYRADDLKLGQPVALKFLPVAVEKDAARLTRFYNEVRTARSVTHNNVCRVYDIGEVDGQHFISMEYVDGEDLATLLRRIGRLPKDKAVQLARQLCAGLAAAHDQGILHRDLKPANVMIDGRGRVRITDFGLAGLAAEIKGHEVRSGTPAYMAPEQLAGKGVSAKSDLYSLGLVLYEMFTGEVAFKAASAADLQRLQSETTPTSPSSLVAGFDPAVERVLLRCLDPQPAARPASALAVAAALPGGDPLAAALAAGETPSPEMVADAGEAGLLRPGVGAALLAGMLLSWSLPWLFPAENFITERVPLPKRPEALADRAAEIITDLGYDEPPADSAFGFTEDRDYYEYLAERDDSPSRWDPLRSGQPAALTFWYRQSAESILPTNPGLLMPSVTAANPAPVEPGMIGVRLDAHGRLLEFGAVPPRFREPEDEPAVDPPPEWAALFALADLEPTSLTPVEPLWTPPVPCDRAAAWTGNWAEVTEVPLRVEACAHRGKPVAFRVLTPWQLPESSESGPAGSAAGIGVAVGLVLYLLVMTGGLVLAWRNLRLGRGDRGGAFRLAAFVFFAGMLTWFLLVSRFPAAADSIFGSFRLAVARVLFHAATFWVLYIAIEPMVRRRWPQRIVSWARLLAGRVRDPLVGRDILIGLFAGIVPFHLVTAAWTVMQRVLGLPSGYPVPFRPDILLGLRHVAGETLNMLITGVYSAMFLLMALLVLQIFLRKIWLAAPAIWLLGVTLIFLGSQEHSVGLLIGIGVVTAFQVFVVIRYGLLAGVAMGFSFSLLLASPFSTDLTAWHSPPTLACLLVFSSLAAFAFYLSLAGRPVFKRSLLQE